LLHFEKDAEKRQAKEIYQIRFTDENLRGLQSSVRVAQALGKGLGRSEILFGKLPEKQKK
jgi:hypothetical protein